MIISGMVEKKLLQPHPWEAPRVPLRFFLRNGGQELETGVADGKNLNQISRTKNIVTGLHDGARAQQNPLQYT